MIPIVDWNEFVLSKNVLLVVEVIPTVHSTKLVSMASVKVHVALEECVVSTPFVEPKTMKPNVHAVLVTLATHSNNVLDSLLSVNKILTVAVDMCVLIKNVKISTNVSKNVYLVDPVLVAKIWLAGTSVHVHSHWLEMRTARKAVDHRFQYAIKMAIVKEIKNVIQSLKNAMMYAQNQVSVEKVQSVKHQNREQNANVYQDIVAIHLSNVPFEIHVPIHQIVPVIYFALANIVAVQHHTDNFHHSVC